jgi:hypothetical protein
VSGSATLERISPTGDGWGSQNFYFSAGWTHIVGMANGGVFFYNRNAILGAAGKFDLKALTFTQTGSFYGMSDWTHVTAFGQTEMIFYNWQTGLAYHAYVNDQGVYNGLGTLAGIGAGFSTFVGASNGYVLMSTTAGYGLVGRPDYYGGMVYSTSGYGYPVGYTHVSAE